MTTFKNNITNKNTQTKKKFTLIFDINPTHPALINCMHPPPPLIPGLRFQVFDGIFWWISFLENSPT